MIQSGQKISSKKSQKVWFFRLLDGKFNEDSKNALKTVIFSLQVGFTSGLVPDCPFKLCF